MSKQSFDGETDVERFFEEMSESYMAAMDRGLEAQAAFLDSWSETVEDATDPDQIEDAYEEPLQAYEAWMNAAEASFDRMGDMLEGEEVDPEEFRDIWLQAANEAFKDTMSTTAFAAATGQTMDEVLDARRQLDEANEETLHSLGFATVGDVQEVGQRLVETERRLHAVEEKIDRLLEQQE